MRAGCKLMTVHALQCSAVGMIMSWRRIESARIIRPSCTRACLALTDHSCFQWSTVHTHTHTHTAADMLLHRSSVIHVHLTATCTLLYPITRVIGLAHTIPTKKEEILVNVTEPLGWKFGDYRPMLVSCQKLHICSYMTNKFFFRWPPPPLLRPWPPALAPQSGGVRTALVADYCST